MCINSLTNIHTTTYVAQFPSEMIYDSTFGFTILHRRQQIVLNKINGCYFKEFIP